MTITARSIAYFITGTKSRHRIYISDYRVFSCDIRSTIRTRNIMNILIRDVYDRDCFGKSLDVLCHFAAQGTTNLGPKRTHLDIAYLH